MRTKPCHGHAILLLVWLLAWQALPVRAGDPGQALDRFHRAAALADIDAYFALMTEEVVFLGTDGSERWQGQAFRDFVRPHFERGRGWEYRPLARELAYGGEGRVAWFDEALEHDRFGRCRGSGVLILEQGQWKIAQYNLSVPVPNALLEDLVAQIAALPQAGPDTPDTLVPVSEEGGAERCRKRRHKTNKPGDC